MPIERVDRPGESQEATGGKNLKERLGVSFSMSSHRLPHRHGWDDWNGSNVGGLSLWIPYS